MYLISKRKKKKKELPSYSLEDILFLESKITENLFNNPICLVQRLKPVHIIQGFLTMHFLYYNCMILTSAR